MKRTQILARVGFMLCVSAILWLALTPNPPSPGGLFDLDKVNHLFAFWVLAILLDYSFVDTRGFGIKATTLLGFGLLIELAQFWVGYRYFEFSDLIADAVGVALYAAFRPWLKPFLDRVLIGVIG